MQAGPPLEATAFPKPQAHVWPDRGQHAFRQRFLCDLGPQAPEPDLAFGLGHGPLSKRQGSSVCEPASPFVLNTLDARGFRTAEQGRPARFSAASPPAPMSLTSCSLSLSPRTSALPACPEPGAGLGGRCRHCLMVDYTQHTRNTRHHHTFPAQLLSWHFSERYRTQSQAV